MEHIKSCVEAPSPELEELREEFCKICTYIIMKPDKGDESFVELREHMETLGNGTISQTRLFYMALPPKVYISVSELLKQNCYSEDGVSRIIVNPLIIHQVTGSIA